MNFSIITPSFNQLDWLRLCVASVRDQVDSFPSAINHQPSTAESARIEHIIQDAGSPGIEDLAREVGANFYRDGKLVFTTSHPSPAKRHHRVTIFCESDNGMYDAVNRGLRKASGDVCAYLNCDEQYLPGILGNLATRFSESQDIEVFFGDTVITDEDGLYLCTRKASMPGLFHTWVCSLSVFTAATFFRRAVFEKRQIIFNNQFRAVGDALWVMDLIRNRVCMKRLGMLTSVSTETGNNLILDPASRLEGMRLRLLAPVWVRILRPLWIFDHRIRRFLTGVYRVKPCEYAIFTLRNFQERSFFKVQAPTFSLPGRFG